MSKFDKWLDLFLEEKGVENALYEVNHNGIIHMIDIKFIIDLIKQCSLDEQKKIKEVIIKIDFRNGNIDDFFNYLAKCYIIQNYTM